MKNRQEINPRNFLWNFSNARKQTLINHFTGLYKIFFLSLTSSKASCFSNLNRHSLLFDDRQFHFLESRNLIKIVTPKLILSWKNISRLNFSLKLFYHKIHLVQINQFLNLLWEQIKHYSKKINGFSAFK